MALPLKLNDSSSDVQAVRAALKARGFQPQYTVLNPNLYDSWVQLAVANYQKKVGLPVTGVVDRATWNTLFGLPKAPGTNVAGGAAADQPATGDTDLTIGLASGNVPQGVTLQNIAPNNPGMSKGTLFIIALAAYALWYAKRRGWLR